MVIFLSIWSQATLDLFCLTLGPVDIFCSNWREVQQIRCGGIGWVRVMRSGLQNSDICVPFTLCDLFTSLRFPDPQLSLRFCD